MGTTCIRFENGNTSPIHQSDIGTPPGVRGIFTTTLTERNNRHPNPSVTIRAFDYHLERLASSVQSHLGLNAERIEQRPMLFRFTVINLIKEFYQKSQTADTLRAKLRISVDLTGSTILIEPWEARWDFFTGISLHSINGIRPIPELKHADTSFCIAASEEAIKNNADEALLVTDTGIVTEGSWSNFFWFNTEGELFTPKSLHLPGVTRRIILAHEPVNVRDVTLAEILAKAREAFVTQATHGIMPISQIDNVLLPAPMPGPLTTALWERFSVFRQNYDTVIELP